jgi:hypothetical protein
MNIVRQALQRDSDDNDAATTKTHQNGQVSEVETFFELQYLILT